MNKLILFFVSYLLETDLSCVEHTYRIMPRPWYYCQRTKKAQFAR